MRSWFYRFYLNLVFGSRWQRTRISEIRKSLHISTLEGIFATIHFALTQGLFLTNYCIALGCPDWLLGVVDALPFLCTGFAFFSPMLVRRLRSRAAVVRIFALLHRAAWLVLALLLFTDLPDMWRQLLMLATLLLANAAAVVAGNAWLAWMADLVPPSVRGGYYARRNTAVGAVALVAMLIGSYVLTWWTNRGDSSVGFAVCFITAVIAALISSRALGRQHDPLRHIPLPRGSVRQTLAEVWRVEAVRRAARFIVVWQFFLGLSAAYFGAHMVRVLEMSPFEMGMFGLVGSLVALASTPYWGNLDRLLGSETVLAATGLLIALHIWPWLAAYPNGTWPIYLVGVVGGFAWAGFNLSWFNHTQTLGPADLRQHTFGVIGFVQGWAFFAGSILGGVSLALLPDPLLTWRIGPWSMVNYFLIFAASAVGRLAAITLLPPGHNCRCLPSLIQVGRTWVTLLAQRPRSRTAKS